MFKFNSYFTLVLISLITFSCSTDSSSEKLDSNNEKLYKKTTIKNLEGEIWYEKEIFYNNQNQITLIEINDTSYDYWTIEAEYQNGEVTTITDKLTYIDSPNETITKKFEVTKTEDYYKLTTENYFLQINYTNEFVDSTTISYFENPATEPGQIFYRDEENNLVKNTGGSQLTFTYSNFDSGKKLDPFGAVMEYNYGNYFKILNLKVTQNNPLTSRVNDGDPNTIYLKYNENGLVLGRFAGPDSNYLYLENEYINL